MVWIWFSRLPEGSSSNSLEAAQVGFSAPGFALTSLDDQKIGMVDFKGKPVILNFWASWCPPCKAEMPAFQQASLEFSDSDLQIIAINATNQDSIPEVRKFIEQYEITFPIGGMLAPILTNKVPYVTRNRDFNFVTGRIFNLVF